MLGWKSPLLYMQGMIHYYILNVAVAPREGRVSRNAWKRCLRRVL